MNSLAIYDNSGRIFSIGYGDYSIPNGGIQYMEVDIPAGKSLVSIDVSVTPHQPIYEEIPPAPEELLRIDLNDIAETTAYMLEDNMTVAETLAYVLEEIANLKEEVNNLRGE